MGTDVGKALAEVSENERIFEDAKAKLAKSKKRLARALMN
jgi:hypothetical protein